MARIMPPGGEGLVPHIRGRMGVRSQGIRPYNTLKIADGGHVDPPSGGDKHWIHGAIKHPGRMKNAAKRAGVSTHEYMEEHKNSSGSLGRAARLGLTLSKMNKK